MLKNISNSEIKSKFNKCCITLSVAIIVSSCLKDLISTLNGENNNISDNLTYESISSNEIKFKYFFIKRTEGIIAAKKYLAKKRIESIFSE